MSAETIHGDTPVSGGDSPPSQAPPSASEAVDLPTEDSSPSAEGASSPSSARAAGEGFDLGGYEPPAELVDADALDHMTSIMRESGISDEQARRLLQGYFDHYSSVAEKMGTEFSLAPRDAVPETAAGYSFDLRAIPHAGEIVDEESLAAMTPVFRNAGLSRKQAQEVVSAYTRMAARYVRDAPSADSVRHELAREWGGNAEAHVQRANETFRAVFGDEAKSIAQVRLSDGSVLGNHPSLIRAFHRLASILPSGSIPPPKATRATVASPSDPTARHAQGVQNEIDSLERDPAFMDAKHPRHEAVIARRNALYRALSGE